MMSYIKGMGRVVSNTFLAAALLAAAIAHSATANAQEVSDEHLLAARKAVAASGSTERLDDILPEMGQKAKQQLIANRPDAADQINVIVDEVTLTLAPRRGDLESEIARAYARVFTLEELNALTEFYTSETGQKLIRETPVIARAIQESAKVWSQGVQRDMQQAVGRKIQEAGLQ